MLTLSLLTLLVNYFGADTIIVYSTGYDNVRQKGVWSSVYLERLLSSEFLLTMRENHSLSWDSSTQRIYRNHSNNAGFNYIPFPWLELESILSGSRYLTFDSAGIQGKTNENTRIFLETTSATDILYANYYLYYNQNRVAYVSPDAGWNTYHEKGDNLDLNVKTVPCTLSFHHHREDKVSWFDNTDTLEFNLSRIPVLAGWLRAGVQVGRRKTAGLSDYEELGGLIWLQDTFRITPRIGLNVNASYQLDTMHNFQWETQSYLESKALISTRLSYSPFEYTRASMLFQTEKRNHDQVADFYDEEVSEIEFSARLEHRFYRRPSHAQWLQSIINFISPGYIVFSHYFSLEKIHTPDTSNHLERNRYTERLSFYTNFRPGEILYTAFRLNHTVQLLHYLHPSYSASSYQRKTSRAYWDVSFDVEDYLFANNSASLSFDWNQFYADSTRNRADRTWSDDFSITLFPHARLQPGADVGWARYENWGMVSGELSLTSLTDEISQTYSLSLVRTRREEVPRGWWEQYREQEWLRITVFAGMNFEIIPSTMGGVWNESQFAGIESEIRPWPYIYIAGRIKFARSNYEVPMEASLTVYSAF